MDLDNLKATFGCVTVTAFMPLLFETFVVFHSLCVFVVFKMILKIP